MPYIFCIMAAIPGKTAEKNTYDFIPANNQPRTEEQKTPIVEYTRESGYDVIYIFDDSTQITRKGGTRAWRNSNPGNLRYTEKTRKDGAIGHAGGFAVFPDKETGMQALHGLLKSDTYKNLSIADAIMRYAPPHENDTQSYKKQLQKMTCLDIETKIDSLNHEQIKKVMDAICVLEGWKAGTEIKSFAPNTTKQKTI